jgi:hypothetical protein
MANLARKPEPVIDPTVIDAQRFYNEVLRERLEPAHLYEYVAIDEPNRDYAVSDDPIKAFDELESRGRRPPFVLLCVGREATFEGVPW